MNQVSLARVKVPLVPKVPMCNISMLKLFQIWSIIFYLFLYLSFTKTWSWYNLVCKKTKTFSQMGKKKKIPGALHKHFLLRILLKYLLYSWSLKKKKIRRKANFKESEAMKYLVSCSKVISSLITDYTWRQAMWDWNILRRYWI